MALMRAGKDARRMAGSYSVRVAALLGWGGSGVVATVSSYSALAVDGQCGEGASPLRPVHDGKLGRSEGRCNSKGGGEARVIHRCHMPAKCGRSVQAPHSEP